MLSHQKKIFTLRIKGHTDCIQAKININKPSAQMITAATLAGISSYGETIIECPNNVRDHTSRLLKHLVIQLKYKIIRKNKLLKFWENSTYIQ